MNSTTDSAAAPAAAALQDSMQRELRAQLATVTGGLAPEPFVNAWWDWLFGVAKSPELRDQLAHNAWAKALETWKYASKAASGDAPLPADGDRRFAHPAWNQWPFNVYAHSYKNWESWLTGALAGVPGMDVHSIQRLEFMGRQVLDAAAPTNFLHSNPELVERTRAEYGQNLVRGYEHWLDDLQRTLKGQPAAGTDKFVIGRDIAVTPGKVILRNDLIELIQYSAQTSTVHAEPVLIIPPWIMKYYILDLSPENSLIRYLVEQGHTVFVVSWKNPTVVDRLLGMEDYFNMGFLEAVDAVTSIIPDSKIHLTGYCLGGTLSAMGAALLARHGDTRIGSLTLFASLCDFSEPGELSLFIDPAQLAMLDAAMSKKGYLDGRQMAGAFQLLRSYDLLWQPMVNTYIRGERAQLNDLMTWNADTTRMPWRMHTDYLRKLYLENQLVNGSYELGGQVLNLNDITVPMFVVATETDHVTPWHAVFKTRQHTRSADFTFVLTSGGHNAGIVSGANNPKRRHRVLQLNDVTTLPAANEWFAQASITPGSWWPTWQQWLHQRGNEQQSSLPPLGNGTQGYWPSIDAPGEYVLQK